MSFLLQKLFGFARHRLAGFLIAGNNFLQIIHVVRFNARNVGCISSNIARNADIDESQRTTSIERLQSGGINDRIIGRRAGEHQRAGAETLIHLRQRTALNRKVREITGQDLSTFDGAVQQHHTRRSLGLKVLKEQTAHASSSHHCNLFSLEGDQLIKSSGLTELQLSQFDGR